MRGIAVLVMLQAHIADAWTDPSLRSSVAFRNLTILGGFGAPLFLWLSGLSIALAGESALLRGEPRAAAARRLMFRGAQIFLLAFLFRLQAFIITPGGSVWTLFRVDILNVMGPAMAAVAAVWWAAGRPRRVFAVCAAGAAAIALSTPPIRGAAAVDALPWLIQWYLRPSGGNTTFTLFPWAGFVFAGGAIGALLLAADAARRSRVLHAVVAGAGLSVAAAGLYAATLPSIYDSSNFWTSSPTYFAVRVGVLMLAFAVAYTIEAGAGAATPLLRPLERLGRHSLFIYWIHVELVYGYASWAWHRSLSLPELAIAFVLFTIAMYIAAAAWDSAAKIWRNRGGRPVPGRLVSH